VAVFQWGWGSSLVGIDEKVPIPSFVPMLMFAIVFGLSMDYEVFLLSRVHEAWIATKDSHRAVAIGIGATARVITTAAAIMIVVFLSFVLDDDPTVKMLAVGMAVAVLIDASVVRMILVPSVMTLLGDRAWWLPGWLDFTGFHHLGHLNTINPSLILAITFGLSMDYEVFLLTRIRERYEIHGSNERAVAEGIASSARIITSAAAIMVVVFGSFSLTGVPTIKEVGVGLASAIAIDATLTRLVLVPATMRLLGDWNWWLPHWLDRRLPQLAHEAPAAGD